jgi:hypothetical protein
MKAPIRTILLTLLLTYVIVGATPMINNALVAEPVVEVKVEEPLPLTIENIEVEIIANKIEHPDIVLRQSVWESGWYRCNDCSLRYNNPFGFRHTSWVDKGNPLGYLKFDTWQDAVVYYKKWQAKRYKGGDYYEFLTKIGYAEDPKYISNLKSLSL